MLLPFTVSYIRSHTKHLKVILWSNCKCLFSSPCVFFYFRTVNFLTLEIPVCFVVSFQSVRFHDHGTIVCINSFLYSNRFSCCFHHQMVQEVSLRSSSFCTSLKASSMGSCSLRVFGLAPRLWFFESRLSRSISSLLPAALHDVLGEHFFWLLSVFFLMYFLERKIH